MTNFSTFRVMNEPNFTASLTTATLDELPAGDVLVRVDYSDVNYKDALAAKENGGVIRTYPMTPGIDLAGEVVDSQSADFAPGDQVLVTGYGLGVSHPGGYSQFQRVPAEWLVKRSAGFSAKDSMTYGTAGFTAALAVQELEQLHLAKDAAILVTGASGGVGSVSIALLKKLGYTNIVALSRKNDAQWLLDLGAAKIVSPDDVVPEKVKPLAKQTFAAVIDTVGGPLLAAVLPQIAYGGGAFLCGNAGGIKIETTVLPFILRGIRVIGIDSVNVSHEIRSALWEKLAGEWNVIDQLYTKAITLEDLPETLAALLAGTHQGRTIVEVSQAQ
ncbi:acrylyl-CoA reductase family protein [Enterococcus casseliflavus]|uniref:acrylyl-CoA reductase family protein n=1 Tax=Enterococcus TaxID=1350 RepID=UPI00115C5819|nr:acryloyl-CoA reductase [Enterococcus casseliflavus]MBO6348516.1 acryloyl-CoA reductase [Enterococcus casseliflavus]MBO6366562.1 acryloyl-CoA reductase [Enterococcus casseliflavus]MCX4169216.1 acryloyl-CoA reductase [Enterococcus casseliflavus]MDV7699979.1 acryloyl-CoA reductase [Enterococcus casseliflavus]